MSVKRHFIVLLLILVISPFLAGMGSLRSTPSPAKVTLPPAHFYDKQDQRVTLDAFKGKVVLVNLWARWCVPCIAELPSLGRLKEKFKGQDFEIVAIAVEPASIKDLRTFLDAHSASSIDAYRDKDKAIQMNWNYDGIPTSFMLDRNGMILQQFNGALAWDSKEMVAAIEAEMQ